MFDLESLYKSLIVRVQDTISGILTEGLSANIQYYAWDARGEIQELPATDLIGLAGWTFRENGGLWQIRSSLVLSTIDDINLFREVQIMDVVHNFWGEGNKVKMLDKNTGVEFTELAVSDFDVLPAGGSEKRNYRPIGIELLRTEG